MENNQNKQDSSNNKPNKNNINNPEKQIPKENNNHLTNDEYIKLFYNSNNAGINKNFPLNVIHNSYKSKIGK